MLQTDPKIQANIFKLRRMNDKMSQKSPRTRNFYFNEYRHSFTNQMPKTFLLTHLE